MDAEAWREAVTAEIAWLLETWERPQAWLSGAALVSTLAAASGTPADPALTEGARQAYREAREAGRAIPLPARVALTPGARTVSI